VLAGGRSSRMGTDKALLAAAGVRLIERVAREAAQAAGSVTLIGDPARYRDLGYAVIPDLLPGCGPLGGIMTALSVSAADWNLILACDMPEVRAEFLIRLLERAEQGSADCLLPAGPSGLPEPLCGVYHRRALPPIRQAFESGVRKVLDGLAGLHLELLRIDEPGPFRNLNTPEEWIAYTNSHTG